MKTIVEKEREIPVVYDVDVVVVGGGPAGVGASVATARDGAETLLIERYGYLGGMATGGLVIWLPKNQLSSGIPREIVDRLVPLEAVVDVVDWALTIDPEIMKNVLLDMLEEEGVKMLLESFAVDAIVKGETVEGVILESKSGRQAVRADVVIDATGDGDIAVRAGAPYKKVGEGELMLPMSLIFIMNNVDEGRVFSYTSRDSRLTRLLERTKGEENPFQYEENELSLFEKASERERPYFRYLIDIDRTTRRGQVAIDSVKVYDVDGTDALDLTEAYIKGRKRIRRVAEFLRRHVPGLDSAYLSYIAPQMGVRETRRVVGEYVLTEKDLYEGRKFDDVVIRCDVADVGPCEIPYRCLVPKKTDNLLIAGRSISCTHEAQILAREIPLCMLMGQAAGTAASLAIKNKTTPRQLAVEILQDSLRNQGLI